MPVLRILGTADGVPHRFDGLFLAEYDPSICGVDPDGHPWCHMVCTSDKTKALNLPLDRLLALRRRSHGLRPDGEPNRPLTAFTVEIEQ